LRQARCLLWREMNSVSYETAGYQLRRIPTQSRESLIGQVSPTIGRSTGGRDQRVANFLTKGWCEQGRVRPSPDNDPGVRRRYLPHGPKDRRQGLPVECIHLEVRGHADDFRFRKPDGHLFVDGSSLGKNLRTKASLTMGKATPEGHSCFATAAVSLLS
jgi:hypothetical protein